MFGQAFRSSSQAGAEHWAYGFVVVLLKKKGKRENGPALTDSPSANHLKHANFPCAMETEETGSCYDVILCFWALPSCGCESQCFVVSPDKER